MLQICLCLAAAIPNVYTSTPNLVINGDPVVWDDTKQLTLTRTLMYALTSKLDVLTSFSGSYKRSEYMDYFTLEPKSESKTQFDSVWLGVNYRGDRIGELVPYAYSSDSTLSRESALRQSKKF